MTYEEWVEQVPKSIKQDPLWSFEVYPKALLLSDFAWEDCHKLMKNPADLQFLPGCLIALGLLAPILKKGMGEVTVLNIAVSCELRLALPAKPEGGTIAAANCLIKKFWNIVINFSMKLSLCL